MIIGLLLTDVLLAAIGQLLLKKGMLLLGPLEFSLAHIPVLIIAVLKNLYIWFALVLYGFGFIFWLFILSKVKLSLAYPALSLVYVLVILGSWLIFKENISYPQLIGIVCIFVGLFFLFQVR
ncbi:MAG: EamA family transporter [Patescibacteria group bacterium]